MSPYSFARDLWVNDPTTFWWLTFISATFAVGVGFSILPLIRRIGDLRSLCVACEGAKRSQNHRGTVSGLLESNPHVARGFRRYDRWWRGALITTRNAAVGDRRLEDFIDFTDLVSPYARPVAGVLPGILVALGILGTFVGLVAGLPSVGTASTAAIDAGGFRDFVGSITKSLGLAFYTSIFGIAGSVIFLLLDKTAVAQIEKVVHELSDAVSGAFPSLSVEEVHRIELEMLEDGMASLKNIGTDLAQSLANYMGPAISSAIHLELAPAVAGIQDTVNRLVTFSTDQQVAGVEAMAKNFVAAMNESMGSQFERLRETISQTVNAQEVVGESIQAFTLQLRSTAQSQGDLIDKTTRLARALTGTVERLEQITASLDSSSEGFGELSDALADAASTIVTRSEEATNVQLRLAEALEQQRASIDKAREDLTAAWEDAVSRAGSAIHQITESTRQVGDGVGDQLVRALESFDSALAEALQRFGGTLGEMNSTVSELPGIAMSIKDVASTMSEHGATLNTSVASLTSITTERLMPYGREVSNAAAELDRVVDAAIQATQVMTTSNGALLEAVHGLARSVNGFRQRLDDVQAAADALLAAGTATTRATPMTNVVAPEMPS